MRLIYELFSKSAVIVGCLPPLKSLFKGSGSFRRCKSPAYNKNLAPAMRLNAIRLGSTETGATANGARRVVSKPIDGGQHMYDSGYDGGIDVPPGAIGVRSDYVSCTLGVWENS